MAEHYTSVCLAVSAKVVSSIPNVAEIIFSHILFSKIIYNIYQLFTHVKLGSNIAVNNFLQVYVTTTDFLCHFIAKGENITRTKTRRWEYNLLLIW